MRWLILLTLLFTGCAETRFYENGQLVAAIQGDATNLTITTYRGSTFHADTLTHSTATAAAYAGGTKLIGGIASGVLSGVALIK